MSAPAFHHLFCRSNAFGKFARHVKEAAGYRVGNTCILPRLCSCSCSSSGFYTTSYIYIYIYLGIDGLHAHHIRWWRTVLGYKLPLWLLCGISCLPAPINQGIFFLGQKEQKQPSSAAGGAFFPAPFIMPLDIGYVLLYTLSFFSISDGGRDGRSTHSAPVASSACSPWAALRSRRCTCRRPFPIAWPLTASAFPPPRLGLWTKKKKKKKLEKKVIHCRKHIRHASKSVSESAAPYLLFSDGRRCGQ